MLSRGKDEVFFFFSPLRQKEKKTKTEKNRSSILVRFSRRNDPPALVTGLADLARNLSQSYHMEELLEDGQLTTYVCIRLYHRRMVK